MVSTPFAIKLSASCDAMLVTKIEARGGRTETYIHFITTKCIYKFPLIACDLHYTRLGMMIMRHFRRKTSKRLQLVPMTIYLESSMNFEGHLILQESRVLQKSLLVKLVNNKYRMESKIRLMKEIHSLLSCSESYWSDKHVH